MLDAYTRMRDALRKTGRPIVYSLCQYGNDAVWRWGTSVGGNPQSRSAWATGASLMASGLVPMTSLTSAKRSLPPTSAGASCLHYG